MNKRRFQILLFSLFFLLGTPSQGEIFFSPKYGFIAEFSEKVQKLEMSSPTGDLANFWVTSNEPFLVLTVNAQKMDEYTKLLEKNGPPSRAQTEKLLKWSLDGLKFSDSLSNVKTEWLKNTEFPVMKVSFSQIGLVAEGLRSYELSYWMFVGDTYYRIKAQALKPDGLEENIQKLYQSFLIVKPDLLKRLLETAKSPNPQE